MLTKLTIFLLTFSSIALSEPNPLKIGISIPLSGPLVEYGVAVQNAFAMAEKDLGKEGYELIYSDNKNHGRTAVTTFKALTEINKIDLLYIWGETSLYSVAPLSDKKEIPIFSMSVDKRSAKNHSHIIRTINPSEDFIKTIYNTLRDSKESDIAFKSLGILMAEDPFFEGLVLELKDQALPNEKIQVVARVPGEQMDLKIELIKAKSLKLDVLAIYLLPGQVSAAYRTMRNLKYVVPTIGTDIFESSSEVADSQGTMAGARYPNIELPKDFAMKYEKEFGNDLQISYAYNAYTTAKFLLSKVNKLNFLKNEKGDLKDHLVKMLLAEKNLDFKIKEDGEFGYYFSYPLTLKTIETDSMIAQGN